jgi:hypothetical protein
MLSNHCDFLLFIRDQFFLYNGRLFKLFQILINDWNWRSCRASRGRWWLKFIDEINILYFIRLSCQNQNRDWCLSLHDSWSWPNFEPLEGFLSLNK